jgi:hypothetical protein
MRIQRRVVLGARATAPTANVEIAIPQPSHKNSAMLAPTSA